jgi:hypothetical protein
MKKIVIAGAFISLIFLISGCSNNVVSGRAGSKVIFSTPLITSTTIGSSTVSVGETSDCDVTVTNNGVHASDMFSFKFIGASRDETPNTSQSTSTWTYLNSTNLDSGTAVAGATGYSNVTRGTYRYSILDKNLQWIGAIISTSTNQLLTDATSTIEITASCVNK